MRKRALLLLTALAGRELPPHLRSALADGIIPLASKLLRTRPDSPLHPGEEAAPALVATVVALAPASSASAAGLAGLLQLSSGLGQGAAKEQLDGALLSMLLPLEGAAQWGGGGSEARVAHLLEVVGRCSAAEAGQLRGVVQGALGRQQQRQQQQQQQQEEGSGRGKRPCSVDGTAEAAAAAAAVEWCYARLHKLLCPQQQHQPASMGSREGSRAQAGAAGSDAAALAQLMFVLGPFSSLSPETQLGEVALLLALLYWLGAAPEAQRGEVGLLLAASPEAPCRLPALAAQQGLVGAA